jgi:hypothetical protein
MRPPRFKRPLARRGQSTGSVCRISNYRRTWDDTSVAAASSPTRLNDHKKLTPWRGEFNSLLIKAEPRFSKRTSPLCEIQHEQTTMTFDWTDSDSTWYSVSPPPSEKKPTGVRVAAVLDVATWKTLACRIVRDGVTCRVPSLCSIYVLYIYSDALIDAFTKAW